MFAGVGERTREGNDLFLEMTETGVIEKTADLQPDGRAAEVRLQVGLAAPTWPSTSATRWVRTCADAIGNIFRFVQAGSEVYDPARPDAERGRLPADPGGG